MTKKLLALVIMLGGMVAVDIASAGSSCSSPGGAQQMNLIIHKRAG